MEMECAALAACAAFRGFSFATFLYSADNLDAAAWDKRGLSRQGVHIRDQVLGLAFEAALALDGLIRLSLGPPSWPLSARATPGATAARWGRR